MSDFTISIGRSAVIPFAPSGEVANGSTFIFTAKLTRSGAAVLTSTNITFDFDANTGQVNLLDSDTAGLSERREYICDVQAVSSASENYVVAKGTFEAVTPVRTT